MLGAAPRVLLGWVSRVFEGHEGLTVAMRTGLLLYFGDATRPHAKWLSAARVLADPSSAGATYVDVRAPERPAAGTTSAGGLAGGAAPAAQASASDPTSAALANTLAEAVSGDSGVNTSSAPASTPQATPHGTREHAPGGPTGTIERSGGVHRNRRALPAGTSQASPSAPTEEPSSSTSG